jgi:hypothetical protein
MATLTRNAFAEIEREKDFTPEETLRFLNKHENFITISEGIKRELRKLKDCPDDDEQLFAYFKEKLKQAGFSTDQRKNAKAWFVENKLPSPHYAIRLCFAFKLKGQDALDFLWKYCKINGLNFRRAEDVVYCYCLENGKSYEEAHELIEKYKEHTVEHTFEISDATKRTQTLRLVFNDLDNLDEEEFFEKLCVNKKNFIGYNKSAHEEFLRIHSKLKNAIQTEIDSFNYL